MATWFGDLYIVSGRYGNYEPTEDSAWQLGVCPDCAGTQFAVVARDKEQVTKWLRCVNCRRGLVEHLGMVCPSIKPLRIPQGVAGVELDAWREVRECLGSGAYTAAAMMCRKLLFHVAVGHGLAPKDSRGRAPGFAQAVQHLENEGLITKRMRGWVDRIKDVGNDAAHEITPVSRESALDVATFTEQLLTLAYEMDALMMNAATVDETLP